MAKKKKSKLKPFDRYEYYSRAVQSPAIDCKFMADTYKEIRKSKAVSLREDFCAAFAICCSWVERDKKNFAIGIDLDLEPINYGKENYLPELEPQERERIQIVRGDVLKPNVPKVDIIAAFNFSYYIFKQRAQLLAYFKKARKGLRKNGLLMVDCFGGKDAQEPNEEQTRHRGFTYYWDQETFNPITHEGMFHIHFKRDGERRREKVFSYDWRVWTIPEIREVMMDAGFRKTYVYWEGTSKRGVGDGHFKQSTKGDECDGWIAYVVGEP